MMPINAIPPITPPTIAPVLEVLPEEGGDVNGSSEGISGNEVEVTIRIGVTPEGLLDPGGRLDPEG